MIRENPASRGTEASAEVLVGGQGVIKEAERKQTRQRVGAEGAPPYLLLRLRPHTPGAGCGLYLWQLSTDEGRVGEGETSHSHRMPARLRNNSSPTQTSETRCPYGARQNRPRHDVYSTETLPCCTSSACGCVRIAATITTAAHRHLPLSAPLCVLLLFAVVCDCTVHKSAQLAPRTSGPAPPAGAPALRPPPPRPPPTLWPTPDHDPPQLYFTLRPFIHLSLSARAHGARCREPARGALRLTSE